jgi:prepilin-type N-terminal cleavage/methylation domain-containing protein
VTTGRRARGFTLLEMMIAMAILSGSLTWMIVGLTRNIKAENHAKLMATATFLARGKMTDFEDELYEKGFGEFEQELNGTFEDKGFTRFTWRTVVDKVELPSSEQIQSVLTKAQEAKQELMGGDTSKAAAAASTSSNPMGAGANAMASQFGIIKEVLEQGIRRVTVRVLWLEGKKQQEVSLVAYYTDVRKVDQSISIGGAAPPGTAPPGTAPPGTAPPTTGTPPTGTPSK